MLLPERDFSSLRYVSKFLNDCFQERLIEHHVYFIKVHIYESNFGFRFSDFGFAHIQSPLVGKEGELYSCRDVLLWINIQPAIIKHMVILTNFTSDSHKCFILINHVLKNPESDAGRYY
jgi:hypothetical protein